MDSSSRYSRQSSARLQSRTPPENLLDGAILKGDLEVMKTILARGKVNGMSRSLWFLPVPWGMLTQSRL